MDTTPHIRHRRVRAHPEELKAQVLAECEQPGASVARVARAHGLNANLVHTWRRQQRLFALPARAPIAQDAFVAVPLPALGASAAASNDIRIELRRGATLVNVSWPCAAAAECGAWLQQLLR